MAENFFGISDTGKLRDNNEDTFIAEALPGKRYIIGCVIDGVGGYAGGEIAASIARDAILRQFKNEIADIPRMMTEALTMANDRIRQEKEALVHYDKMACVATLAVADLTENLFYYAHVGDTRLYLLRDSSLIKVTKDHSFVGFLEDSGRLSEDAAMKHPKRNEIDKALGFIRPSDLRNDYIETGQSPFLPGDMLLVCSDGLTDLVNKSSISAILAETSSLAEKARQLVDAANNNGGKDNITTVLIKNSNKPVKSKATRPVKPRKGTTEPEEMPLKETERRAPAADAKPAQITYDSIKPAYLSVKLIAALVCVCVLLTAGIFLCNESNEPGNIAPLPADSVDAGYENTAGDSIILVDTTKGPVPYNDKHKR